MKHNKKTLGYVLLSLFLAGCISVGSGPKEGPSSIYTLNGSPSAKTPARAATRGGAVLVIPKPDLPAGFATDRIALYFEKDRRLDYYADAKWSTRLDELLQDLIVQRAKEKLPNLVVGTPDIGPSARYQLAIKVMDLNPVYADTADKPPRLDVSLLATVLAMPGKTVKTQFTVKKSAPASANTLTIVTKELGSLLQTAIDETLMKAAPQL